MTVQWIPGHTGIEGNEIADNEAKKQAKLPPVPQSKDSADLEQCKKTDEKMQIQCLAT